MLYVTSTKGGGEAVPDVEGSVLEDVMYEQPLFAEDLSLQVLEGQGGRTKIQLNNI